jgi:release factor glutamine methyltransferase
MTVAQIHEQLLQELQPLYSQNEARVLSYELLQHFGKLSRAQLHAFPETVVLPEVVPKIQTAVAGLLAHKPLQYITGETMFCGFPIAVSGAVLIPRPETEELVRWVVNSEQQAADSHAVIMDLCTGSGCIAIAVKKLLPLSTIYACDISQDALEVAKRNALNNHVSIDFFPCDIVTTIPFDKKVTCIISNPPYVRQCEKALMNENVLRYEPHQALFVEDADPLLFYRAIVRFAQQRLQKNGSVFVEINEALGNETKALFAAAGFASVELRKDINGKDRIIKAVL